MGRSVSLSHCDSKNPDSPPKRNISAKRKSPPSPVSVQERMSRFKQVQNKYLRQCCQKELNREKMKQEKSKKDKKAKNSSEDEESIASMLKAIHADIWTMKSNLQDNTSKVNTVTSKIEVMESNFERSERENQIKFADIKSDIAKVEKSVTANVIESMEPRFSALKPDMSTEMRDEMRKLLKDEMENTYKLERRIEDVVEA